jgi:hypothetical protein
MSLGKKLLKQQDKIHENKDFMIKNKDKINTIKSLFEALKKEVNNALIDERPIFPIKTSNYQLRNDDRIRGLDVTLINKIFVTFSSKSKKSNFYDDQINSTKIMHINNNFYYLWEDFNQWCKKEDLECVVNFCYDGGGIESWYSITLQPKINE